MADRSAVIDPLTGIATGKSQGTSNIAVSYKNITYPFVVLTVGPPTMTITVTPNPATLQGVGSTVRFYAIGKYSDTTIPDVDLVTLPSTNQAIWSCPIAGINNNPFIGAGHVFTLQTSAKGTTIVKVIWRTPYNETVSGLATLYYDGSDANSCNKSYVHFRQNDNFPVNDSQYNPQYPMHLNNYWTDLPFADHTTAETVPPRIKGGVLSASIGDVGCLMVSAAMALTATGTPVDPGQLNAYLNGVPTGYVDREVNFDWIKAYAGSRISDVSPSWIPTASINQDIITALSTCNLVILQVSGNDGYFATHFVLATAYSNNKIYIYDPWWRYKAGDSPVQLDDMGKRYNIAAYKILTVK